MLTAGDPRHGLPAGVDARCVCRRCGVAGARLREAHRTTACGAPRWQAARRVRALLAHGYTPREVADAAGIEWLEVAWLTEERRAPTVSRATLTRLIVAYGPMSGRPLTGDTRDMLRGEARRRGWFPPAAYDDIDDPDERPRRTPTVVPDMIGPRCPDPWCDHGSCTLLKIHHHDRIDPVAVERVLHYDVVPTSRAEKELITARWIELGRSLRELERLTGWNADVYRKATA